MVFFLFFCVQEWHEERLSACFRLWLWCVEWLNASVSSASSRIRPSFDLLVNAHTCATKKKKRRLNNKLLWQQPRSNPLSRQQCLRCLPCLLAWFFCVFFCILRFFLGWSKVWLVGCCTDCAKKKKKKKGQFKQAHNQSNKSNQRQQEQKQFAYHAPTHTRAHLPSNFCCPPNQVKVAYHLQLQCRDLDTQTRFQEK